jgi:hypothetical protein
MKSDPFGTLRTQIVNHVKENIDEWVDSSLAWWEYACSEERYHDELGVESPIEAIFLAALDTAGEWEGTLSFKVSHARNATEEERLKAKPLHERPDLIVSPQKQIGEWRVDFFIQYRRDLGDWKSLVVECDGHDYHERTKDQAARDRSRDRAMTVSGITSCASQARSCGAIRLAARAKSSNLREGIKLSAAHFAAIAAGQGGRPLIDVPDCAVCGWASCQCASRICAPS